MKHSIGILLVLASLFTAGRVFAQHDGQYEYRLRNDMLRSPMTDATAEACALPHVTVFLVDGRLVGRREALERIRIGNVFAARRTVCKPRSSRIADRVRLVYVELLTEGTIRSSRTNEAGLWGRMVPVSVSALQVADTTGHPQHTKASPGRARDADLFRH